MMVKNIGFYLTKKEYYSKGLKWVFDGKPIINIGSFGEDVLNAWSKEIKMIRFTCDCGSHNKAPDEYAGRPVKCPKCGRFTVVSIDLDKDVEDKDAIEIIETQNEEVLDQTSNIPSEKSSIFSKTPKKVRLFSVISVVIFVGIALISVCVGIIISEGYKINTLQEDITIQKEEIQQAATQKEAILRIEEEQEELKKKLEKLEQPNRDSETIIKNPIKPTEDIINDKDETESK